MPERAATLRLRSVWIHLYFLFLIGLSPGYGVEWSSSERSPAPAPPNPEVDAAELVRDAPLYPPLQDTLEDPYEEQDKNELSYNDLETSIEESRLLVTPEDMSNIETEDETKVQSGEVDVSIGSDSDERTKRSSGQEWDKSSKPTNNRRVKTGDTILNIRGAVRDAIGDAGAAPGPRASSRVDTFVIRPAQDHAHRMPIHDQPRAQPSLSQVPKNEREILVEAHSRARISCDLMNVTNLRWYKDNEQMNVPSSSGHGGSEALWKEGETLVVGRATRGDSGAWRCAGSDKTGKVVSGKPTQLLIYEQVRSVYLAVDGRRLDAGNTWVPVRDKTVLEVKCVAEGGVPPPELSWRLLAIEPTLDHRPYLRVYHTNYSIEGMSSSHVVVTAARELHNATLQCEARQRNPKLTLASAYPTPASESLTAKLEIHVTYPPSFVISRWPGFGISLSAGGAAALRCDVDANPPARAWWLRDDADPTSSPPPLEAGDESARGSATLRWGILHATHAGWYRCRATWLDSEYSSIGYYLNVLAAEENSETATEVDTDVQEPDHQKVDVPLGGNVQLHCPKGSVGCWWRRVVGNSSESWAPAGSQHAHGVLGIKDALYQEGGEYRCVGTRTSDIKRLKELKRVTLRVTGGATATALSAEPAVGGWRLECGACGRGVRVVWLRSGVVTRASLNPDLAQHCWRAVLHVVEPDEVWCVAATTGAGAVAVFPRRAPPPSPAPARHTVRALQDNAVSLRPQLLLLVSVVLLR
ncbi:LOW QUALITY PROTEIN: uncharacterized protein ACR2FA_012085 [Aphomia sociella]